MCNVIRMPVTMTIKHTSACGGYLVCNLYEANIFGHQTLDEILDAVILFFIC